MPELACSGQHSCCVSDLVPGGAFQRGLQQDAHGVDLQAEVAPFVLDRYEVTVGRFRRFLELYDSEPVAVGSGKNLNNGEDKGWQQYWSTEELLPLADDVKASLRNCTGSTWTDTPDANEQVPINCVTWYEAYAFCIWDGGRLPTEAEWNFAAAGGDEQRLYPWTTPGTPEVVSDEQAVYGPNRPAAVGSKLLGLGKWGHADLAGNVHEWLLDWYHPYYTRGPCLNCAELTSFGQGRVIRGGGFSTDENELKTSARSGHNPRARYMAIGFRCARNL